MSLHRHGYNLQAHLEAWLTYSGGFRLQFVGSPGLNVRIQDTANCTDQFRVPRAADQYCEGPREWYKSTQHSH